jgi:hypothetical protein
MIRSSASRCLASSARAAARAAAAATTRVAVVSSSSSFSTSSSSRAPASSSAESTDTAPNGTTTHFGYKQVKTEDKKGLVHVAEVFSNVAADYDVHVHVMNDLMSAGLHRVWKDDFIKLASVKASAAACRAHYDPALADDEGRMLKLLDVAAVLVTLPSASSMRWR